MGLKVIAGIVVGAALAWVGFIVGEFKGQALGGVISELGYGQAMYAAASQIRQGNAHQALSLLDTMLEGTSVSAQVFKTDLRKPYAEQAQKFLSQMDQYRKKYPGAVKSPEALKLLQQK